MLNLNKHIKTKPKTNTQLQCTVHMYSLTFRICVTTPPGVWTKWNGVIADNVVHTAGTSILLLARGVFAAMHSACGEPGGLPLGSAMHF